MNRSSLLAVALILTASIVPPAAWAQTPGKPLPTTAPAVVIPAPKPATAPVTAPSDPLKGLRVHLAALRSLPLNQPQAVLRAPQTVPHSSWMEVAHSINVTHR